MSVFYLKKTRLNFTSNFLHQNNPKSKYLCKNELIYIRDFEAVEKLAVLYYQVQKPSAPPPGFKRGNKLLLVFLNCTVTIN